MQLAESMWGGVKDGYEWLVATCSMGDLLGVCPQIVTGKFIAITAFDSGSLVLTGEETAQGWYSRFGIAYSPSIADVESVPYDNLYDEWYIFNTKTEIGRLAERGSNIFEVSQREEVVYPFVNYHLGLHLEMHKQLADLFWMQTSRIRPEVYLADCDSWVTLVSRNKELFAAAREGIGKLSPA